MKILPKKKQIKQSILCVWANVYILSILFYIFSVSFTYEENSNKEEIQLVILIWLTVFNKHKMINFNINGLKY